jgi:hypothetical protein
MMLFAKLMCAFCLVAASAPSNSEELEPWEPKIEFDFDAPFGETMMWVSGWSYALTAVGRSAGASQGGKFCLPSHGFIESRVMLEILNEKFRGKRVSAEQASQVLWEGVEARYPCGKNP